MISPYIYWNNGHVDVIRIDNSGGIGVSWQNDEGGVL